MIDSLYAIKESVWPLHSHSLSAVPYLPPDTRPSVALSSGPQSHVLVPTISTIHRQHLVCILSLFRSTGTSPSHFCAIVMIKLHFERKVCVVSIGILPNETKSLKTILSYTLWTLILFLWNKILNTILSESFIRMNYYMSNLNGELNF